MQALRAEKERLCHERDELSARLQELEKTQDGSVTRRRPTTRWSTFTLRLNVRVCVDAERLEQEVSQRSVALRAELDEERRKYQGLLREFTRLEQRYDNLREMSQLAEVPPTSHATHHRTDELRFLTSLWVAHLIFSFPLSAGGTVGTRPQEDRLGPESEPGANVAAVAHPPHTLTLPLHRPFARAATQDQRHLAAAGQEVVGLEERRSHGETSHEWGCTVQC